MYARYKEFVAKSDESSISTLEDSSVTESDDTSTIQNEIDKPEQKPDSEKVTDEKLAEFAKQHPHLQKTFKKIDEFLKEIRANPTLEGGKYGSGYALSGLMFMGFKDVDKIIIGEYFYLTDAAELIKQSYELLLGMSGISSLASFSSDEIDAMTGNIPKLINLRDIICSNITRNIFAMRACESGMMKHFVEDLKVLKVEDVTGADGEPTEIFDSVIVTLHNCARYPGTRQMLRDYGTVTQLLPFLKCKSKSGKLSALVTVSKLVDETENEYILADETIFQVIFDIFDVAWKNSNHYGFRWSVGALMNGMAHLAKNDSNKKVLYEKGAVSTLIKVLKDGFDNEKEDAVKCIWELAFDKEIKKELAKNEELLSLLKELKSSDKDSTRKAAKGALWEIHQEERAQTPACHVKGGTGSVAGHVMISYQWDDQKILKKVKESLTEAGFKVWMDVDHMSGSTLEAMANAVENSAVVLVCMSEKYKLSQNCRSEAGYAFSTKKDIIPLIMQRSYTPDGWLGILRESKLFFDFSGKYPYKAKLEDLIRELGHRGKEHALNGADGNAITASNHPTSSVEVTRGQALSRWSDKDVHNWLTKLGLQNKPSLKHLSTENLQFLRDLSRNAPEFFYNYLRTELDLKSLNDMTAFCRALEKL